MIKETPTGLSFLHSRLDYERQGMPKAREVLNLKRTRRLLRRLGDPQDGLKIIHVAGTKGKGSTSALIANALSSSGIRTGLYCSPHLHALEERFRIDGEAIRLEELEGLIDQVRPEVEALDQGSDSPLTFFEITTAMALLRFAQCRADAVVLEVGLGGRLDSTNVVHPILSVITSISFDHTKILGDTLEAIASEKAGIIKRSTRAISGVRDPGPAQVIREIARNRRAPFRETGVDYRFRYFPPDPSPPLAQPMAGAVETATWRTDWGRVPLPMLGPHQAENLALALAALDAVSEAEPRLDAPREVRLRGIAQTRIAARVEVLGERPWIVVDGAHNVASAQALADTLKMCFPDVPRTLIYGSSRDKDALGQIRVLAPLFAEMIAARYVLNPRAIPAAQIAEMMAIEIEAANARPSANRSPFIADNPAEALAIAQRVTPDHGLIVVTGSLFLAGESRAHWLGLGPGTTP